MTRTAIGAANAHVSHWRREYTEAQRLAVQLAASGHYDSAQYWTRRAARLSMLVAHRIITGAASNQVESL